jgi:hypothetical protein
VEQEKKLQRENQNQNLGKRIQIKMFQMLKLQLREKQDNKIMN